MDKSSFKVPNVSPGNEFTGERYIPGITGRIRTEHLHRYLFALQYAAGLDILDVACGEGYGSFLLSQVARSVKGVDIAAEVIERANETYGSPSLSFRVGDAMQIPIPDDSVDMVTCFETIEHVTDPEKLLAEVRRVLRKDGRLIISTPNALANDGAWHENNPYHVHEMSRAELESVLSQTFQHVALVEQRFLHGSVIIPRGSDGASDEGVCELFDSNDSITFERTTGSIGDFYILAIASNAELQATGISVVNDEADLRKLEDEFRYAVATLHAFEDQRMAIDEQIALLRREVNALLVELGDGSTVGDGDRIQGDDIPALLEYLRSFVTALRLAHSRMKHERRITGNTGSSQNA